MSIIPVRLEGQVFELLTVIKHDGKNRRGQYRWLCRCKCGKDVTVNGYDLRSGNTGSCGCRTSKARELRCTTHGQSRRNNWSPAYRSWATAKGRCFNQKQSNYKWYGGRGVTMCDRWRDSFENFLADMGERPEGRTLDRYPNKDGNYEPGNCRWATKKQQANNRKVATHRNGKPFKTRDSKPL